MSINATNTLHNTKKCDIVKEFANIVLCLITSGNPVITSKNNTD